MSVYSREDDLVIALQEATKVMHGKRFNVVACSENDIEAAWRVTQVADVYVAWLRQVTTVTLTLEAIEEMDTGEVALTPEGNAEVTNIDTSQQARYSVTAKDDRGFAADYALAARASNASVVAVTYLNVGDTGNTSNGTTNPDGTSSEVDQLVAAFAGTTGTSTVEVFDPANPDVVLAVDTIVANPGAVAAAELGAAVVEEIPAPPAP